MSTLPESAADPRGRPPSDQLGDARNRAHRALFGKPAPPASLPETDDQVIERGSMLGRYLVIATLGRGGMGTVFEAYDETLGRVIAIKLLHTGTTERHAQRLQREAKALAKLSHPNVVHVYEVGRANDQWYIAMELVPGQTLRQWQADEHDWRACVDVYLQAGHGLDAAHAAGLVHRDFKPDNCIIDEAGRVRVLDFGLVTDTVLASQGSDSGEASTTLDAEAQLPVTRTGALLGTVAYMPPEQLDGRPANASGDQFSFCVSLYEALYGQRPFPGSSVATLMDAIEAGRVRPPPADRHVPGTLRAVLLRGLSSQASQRWPSMAALLDELRREVTPRTQRFVAAGLTAGLVALGTGVAFGQYAQVKDRCTGARSQLESIWDDARQQRVHAAIVGTEQPYAADTWARVSQQLDDYAERWAARHTAVCEATRVTQEQTEHDMGLRMSCLHDRKVALNATVDVLADADATVVENAMKLVAALPGFGRCDDLPALRAAVPPPEDPDDARQVEVLREQLAKLAARQKAGRYKAALQAIDGVAEQAEALRYEPLMAEVKSRRGQLLDMNGRYAEAEQELREGYTQAMEHRHDEVARDTARHLAWVVGIRQSRHAEGLVWGQVALAQALRDGDDEHPVEKAAVLRDIGSVLANKGALDDALVHLRQALALLDEAPGEHHRRRGTILDRIGIALARQGHLADALRHQQRALALVEQTVGPHHPHVANLLNNISVVLRMQGEHDRAIAKQMQALSIYENAWGEQHPLVATSIDNVGAAFAQQGRLDEARRHFERALAIREQTLGEQHPDVANSLNNLGNVTSDQGQLEVALDFYRRSVAIKEQALGPRHAGLASTLNNMAVVLMDTGRPQRARVQFERARSIWEEALGPEHPEVANALVGLARAALQSADFEVAREYAQRAVVLRESTEVSPAELARARFVWAQTLGLTTAERARARALAMQARDAFATQGPGYAGDVTQIDQWLEEHPA
ncbi:MAG: serine/threonine-protein kinase [Myxococcota bacterium]